jgi:hypothetical protein
MDEKNDHIAFFFGQEKCMTDSFSDSTAHFAVIFRITLAKIVKQYRKIKQVLAIDLSVYATN